MKAPASSGQTCLQPQPREEARRTACGDSGTVQSPAVGHTYRGTRPSMQLLDSHPRAQSSSLAPGHGHGGHGHGGHGGMATGIRTTYPLHSAREGRRRRHMDLRPARHSCAAAHLEGRRLAHGSCASCGRQASLAGQRLDGRPQRQRAALNMAQETKT